MILVKQNYLDGAIEFLQRARAASHGDEDIRYELALALAVPGDDQRAITELHETIRIEPLHTSSHDNLAVLLAQRGLSREATASLRAAINANPLFAEAHYQLGIMLAQNGDY